MEDKGKNIVFLLKLSRVQTQAFQMVTTMSSEFIFSTREKLEQWLLDHDFRFGQHPDYAVTEKPYWYHERDKVWDHISVCMEEKQLDDEGTPVWLAMRH